MLRLDAACTDPPEPDPRPDPNNIGSERLDMRQDASNHPNETKPDFRVEATAEVDAVTSGPGR